MNELVRQCYFDDPIERAVERFESSEEWAAVRDLLSSHLPADVLDIGAGRGISSHAFAQAGCNVVALEPDNSQVVGIGAMSRLVRNTGASMSMVQGVAEELPFADRTFGIVHGRAVLHHAGDLKQLCREAARVLRRGGIFLATREHVISDPRDLPVFLSNHSLHFLYGGENAYLLKEYIRAIEAAGLRVSRVIGPSESVINYAPMSIAQFDSMVASAFRRVFGEQIGEMLGRLGSGKRFYGWYQSIRSDAPGRHYSFLALKLK